VYKHVLTILTADEAKTLGVVEPLHCSLFHARKFLVNDFAAQYKKGFSGYNSAENQSVSNDGEMLARLANFPDKNFTKLKMHCD
jgi:hypothetical protein